LNINTNYLKLNNNYLFSVIEQKINAHKAANPERTIISLGVGDVTLPLAPVVTEALHRAVTEMESSATFRGYGNEQGYLFLREAVCGYYSKKGVELHPDEIFINDGAGSDLGNILDIFFDKNTALIPTPVYPAYVDINTMAGNDIAYMDGNIKNNFLPMPDKNLHADIIYLCSPNNPTGAVYTKKQLKTWVEYALENDAVIIFDSAYESFVQDNELPTSIYQIDRAKECVIEICSLSKTAGFTGTRCGYTVVPQELIRGGESLNKLWLRNRATKTNGISYIIQRGAEAVFTEEGLKQVQENIKYYLNNAKHITETLKKLNIWHTGGENAPYVWFKCPMPSWDFFDYLLEKTDIIGIPGAGFGENGNGFFRLSAFGKSEDVRIAMERIARCKI